MKVTEIDKPILSPIKVYLDVESFLIPSQVNPKIVFTPIWVKQVIDKLSYDFEFYGLQHRKNISILRNDISYDFVQEVLELPREHWKMLLNEEGTVIFYFGKPSNLEILQYLPETMRFPFTSDLELIKAVVQERVNVGSFVNTVSPGKRGKDNRIIKFIKDMF